jgi:hypothetical protein
MRTFAVGSAVISVLSGVVAVLAWRNSCDAAVAGREAVAAVRQDVATLRNELAGLANTISAIPGREVMPERVETVRSDPIDLQGIDVRLKSVEDGLARIRDRFDSIGRGVITTSDGTITKDPGVVSQAIAACLADSKDFVSRHRLWFGNDVYRGFGAPDRIERFSDRASTWIYTGGRGEGAIAIQIGLDGVDWATFIPADKAATWPH